MILIACCFLIAVFFVPIWHIKLNAPQYPGGLDMYIWVDKITGTDEFTLQNINILNHYIGMRAIRPDSFKELQIMPYVVIFFIITGIITVFLNKKKLLMAWLGLLIIGGTVGLVDFYLWQQAFGNELDPYAPIKIEGMTYSPPFLGNKTLLNIKASSYPYWGGVFFGMALLLAVTALLYDIVKKNKNIVKRVYAGGIAACSLFLLSSCQPEPQSIDFGFDSCTHCKMTISDMRYGSELVTTKGKVYKFDAIECMAEYQKGSLEDYAFQLVTDFSQPDKFIDAPKAWYLQSGALPSPMGMNLSAFEKESDAKEFAREKGGKVLNWNEIKQLKIGGGVNEGMAQPTVKIKTKPEEIAPIISEGDVMKAADGTTIKSEA